MGGIKTKKGRGPDKKKRKSRRSTRKVEPVVTDVEEKKPDLIRDIIQTVSEKLKREQDEPWTLGVGPRVTSRMLGRHTFKGEGAVEIDLKEL